MKRLIALLLVVLMAVSLCGCAGEKSKVPEQGTALNIFYQAIMDAQPENAEELILFEESNPDLIASFYPGLDSIELSQQAYYMPPIATHPCEIVLVEVKNDAICRMWLIFSKLALTWVLTTQTIRKAPQAGSFMHKCKRVETLFA